MIQFQDLFKEIEENAKLKQLKDLVIAGKLSNKHYTVQDGKLWYKRRLVIPKNSEFIPLILAECHDGTSGGHSGVLKTVNRVQSMFHWEGLPMRVRGMCQSVTCVKHINIRLCHRLAFYKHYQYRNRFGKTCQWIS